MPSRALLFATALLWLAGLASPTRAQSNLLLSNGSGAGIAFTQTDAGWTWTGLTTPANPDGFALAEGELTFGAGERLDVLIGGWALVAEEPTRLVFELDALASGVRVRRAFSFGPAPHVLRIDTWVRSLDQPKLLDQVGLLSVRVAGETFRLTGNAPASFPVFGNQLFAGVEDLCAESRAEGSLVRLYQTPDLSAGTEWQFVAAAIVGWPAPREALFLPGESRMRDAFLQYLDTIRVKPEGINLHSDTWWTLPSPYTEGDILRDIDALRRGFFERTGLFFNTYALDLGWSNPQSLWRIDEQSFPDGFRTVQERLAELNCRAGLWVSPSSGYPPGLDNRWLETEGYEVQAFGDNPYQYACFALGGRYQRAFADTVAGYARDYGLGHVIFDGLDPTCENPAHLHATGLRSAYSIAAGFADVMDRLRRDNPRIILEPLSCGHPPSPWWNRHTPFLLGPAGDDVPYGRVPSPDWTESLVSARDIAYRASQEKWLVRTQALETFDIIRQSPGAFAPMALMAVGRGRWFVSANVRPELMAPTDWDFLAALIRWERANQRYLVDARMFGGRPEKREAYGYVFHNADKDIFCLRNPWIEPRTIQLPARVAEARELRMIHPRRGPAGRLEPNVDGPTIVLAPYEIMFLETVPATDETILAETADSPQALLAAEEPEVFRAETEAPARGFDFYWTGSLTVPELSETELCVLIEGAPAIAAAHGAVMLNGEPARIVKTGSAGQFGAAAEPSPENWVWLIAPVEPGEHEFTVVVNVPTATATVGVYLRGRVPATSDPVTDDAPAFPLSRPDSRAWSQTLLPSKTLGTVVDDPTG